MFRSAQLRGDERAPTQGRRKPARGADFGIRGLALEIDQAQVLLESPENKAVQDWSPDGRDIWALPVEGSRKPFAVVQTGFGERGARFSPDGRWISYESNETGRGPSSMSARPQRPSRSAPAAATT